MNPGPPFALKEWAVTCDALARGEQILLLRKDLLESREGPARPAAEGSTGAEAVPHETFWMLPDWSGQMLRAVADPYRDRIRALQEAERGDGRSRLQYLARVEYSERIQARERLLNLDGHHTLNASAVERRLLESRRPGLLFMVLRIYRRPEAVVLEESAAARKGEGWIPLPDEPELRAGPEDGELEPVLSDERFLTRKAELLQLSDSVRAV